LNIPICNIVQIRYSVADATVQLLANTMAQAPTTVTAYAA